MITLDEKGFLDAIRQEPQDDGLHLIYADWLLEQGEDQRSDLIRVMVEREGLPADHRAVREGCDQCRRWNTLNNRIQELIRSVRLWALPPGPVNLIVLTEDCFGTTVNTLYFSRGVVKDVVCHWDFWNQHADWLIQRHPIGRVKLLSLPEKLYWRPYPGGGGAYPHPTIQKYGLTASVNRMRIVAGTGARLARD